MRTSLFFPKRSFNLPNTCKTGPTGASQGSIHLKIQIAGAYLAALLLPAGLAMAQAPNPLDTIADKIPFDVAYGAPISLDRAHAVITAAIAECQKRGWGMSIAVVDSGANLVAFSRMDRAQLSGIAISEHKARYAAQSRRETRMYEASVQGGNVYQLTLDGVMASRGGVPLIEDGKLIGAVGASGGAGAQDEVCAKAGASVINK